jgi:hypothetical protein
MSSVPQYVIDMVRRKAPENCGVIEGSTAVVSFGNFREARVATLGINPSLREFLVKKDAEWLPEPERRLATCESLGAKPSEDITLEQAIQIVTESDNYFHKNPYDWFDNLEKFLVGSFNASYRDGSACHLDLSQWATDPTWGSLTKQQQEILLEDGVQHLRLQLAQKNITHVIVNGKQVWDEIKRSGLAEFEDKGKTTFSKNKTSCTLRVGYGEGTTFLGWTANIPTQHGSTEKKFHDELCEWLRENK